jgi:hypothetical protein
MPLYKIPEKENGEKNPMAVQKVSLPTAHTQEEWLDESLGSKKAHKGIERDETMSQMDIPNKSRLYGVLFRFDVKTM